MPNSRPFFFPFTLAVFTLASFVSATLLFLVQPMIGKMVLPLLGGTPAVWNTCMVFFQAVLLAGYLYAHALTSRLARRPQMALHAVVLLLPLLCLPISVDTEVLRGGEASAVGRLLVVLLVSAGLPFFVVSTSAPLLQRWFAGTGHPAGRDPYFLYAASNCGSLLALLAYPTLIEPHLRLSGQSRLWVAGYVALAALILVCAALALRSSPLPAAEAPETAEAGRPTPFRRLHWVALAFVPSSLMLGATTFVTTDIASVPLLWVLPLALYLLSFVVAFARPPLWLRRALVRVLPAGVLIVIFLILAEVRPASDVLGAMIGLHLGVLFLAAVVCHGELAALRPSAADLTEFYLWMSFGGVLGGLFNALLAPLIFRTVAEYPLALLLACLLLPRASDWRLDKRWADLGAPVAVGVLALCLLSGLLPVLQKPEQLGTFLRFGTPLLLCALFVGRPVRFALALGAVLAANGLYASTNPNTLHRERSFFGVLEVERWGDSHRLVHGTTMHGMQSLDPARRGEPLTYYHRQGPIGQVMAARERAGDLRGIAVIGLGTGTMAAYGGPGRRVTFYEIDPAVVRIAGDPRYFTYLRDCRERGGVVDIVLGDARLRLGEARGKTYDVIVVDAFSSDAIPIHLLTREALELYLSRLAENGVVAFHISNRYLALGPVLGNLAQKLGLAGRTQHDDPDWDILKSGSDWLVIARRREALGALARDARWELLPLRRATGVWTDDFSNVFGALR